MEIKLEEIIGYVPYGLKVEMLAYKRDYVGRKHDEIIGVECWSKNKDWCLLTEGGSKPALDRIRPLLYPLESLTKEIEVTGEKFVPAFKLVSNEYEFNNLSIRPFTEITKGFEVYHKDLGHIMNFFTSEGSIGKMPHYFIVKMQKWKIDIHNLIGRNLAIDVNSLEINPYK